MPIVAMPDGTQVNFPDEMPPEQIKGMIASKFPDSVPQPDFSQRVSSDLSNRQQELTNVLKDQAAGGSSFAPLDLLHMAGPVARGISDIVGEGIKSVSPLANQASSLALNLIPPAKIIQNIGQQTGATDALQNAGQQVINSVKNQSGQLASQYPKTTQTLNDVASLAGVEALAKTGVEAAGALGEGLGAAGNSLVKSGQTAADANKQDFLQKLITPKETPTEAARQFSNSKEKGIFRTAVTIPEPFEQDVINTLSDLPVSPNKSLLKNYNIIDEANDAEAEGLKTQLNAADAANPSAAIIPKTDIMNEINKSIAPVLNEPLLGKAGKNRVNEAIAKIDSMIPAQGVTASDLLDIRKKYDKDIIKYKGEASLDPVRANAFTEASRAVRQTTNNIVDAKYPTIDVRSSLDKQHHMFTALDAIETKAKSQGKNIFSRVAQKAANFIPVKGAIAKGAVLAAGAGAGAASGPLAAAPFAAYGAYKAAASPALRIGAGKTIRTLGDYLTP